MERGIRVNKSVIVTGQIGCGRFGRILHRNFVPKNGFCVKRLVVQYPSKAREPLQAGASVSGKIDDILNDSEIEAVVVASPLPLHYQHGMAVLRAGKHLFIEKPVTENAQQARALEREAEARGLAVIVDYTFSFSPVLLELKHLIADRWIGEFTGFDFRWDQDVMPADRPVHAEISSHVLSILQGFMPLSSFAIKPVEAGEIHRLNIYGCLNGKIDVRLNQPKKERCLLLTGTGGSLGYSFAVGGAITITREGQGATQHGNFIEGNNLVHAITAFHRLMQGAGQSNLPAAIAVTEVLEKLTL
jgi:predicted dehydrogenase